MALNISDALSQNVVDKRIDVLQRIKQFGSISEAARSAGISYKAAWQADRKSTRLNSSHITRSRMPSSA